MLRFRCPATETADADRPRRGGRGGVARRVAGPVLLLLLAGAPGPAAEPDRPAPPRPAPLETRTAKERMGGKAADEQRVDDCKVPPERRTRPRPAACPGGDGR
jgi:hypothetical protein